MTRTKRMLTSAILAAVMTVSAALPALAFGTPTPGHYGHGNSWDGDSTGGNSWDGGSTGGNSWDNSGNG